MKSEVISNPQSLIDLSNAQALLDNGNPSDALSILSKIKSYAPFTKRVDYLRAKCIKSMNLPYADSAAEQALLEEIAHNPCCQEAKDLLSVLQNEGDIYGRELKPYYPPDFLTVLGDIRDYTMLANERLYTMWRNIEDLFLKGLDGNVLEYGSARGGSATMLAYLLKKHGSECKVYAFDSFNGMPKPSEIDKYNGVSARDYGWGEGTCASGIESIKEISNKLGLSDYIEIVPGQFEETLMDYPFPSKKILAAHIDCDWYKSVWLALSHFIQYRKETCYLQIDDYGYWEGVKKAADQLLFSQNFNTKLIDIDGFSAGFIFR